MAEATSLAEIFKSDRFAALRSVDGDPYLAVAKLFRDEPWLAHQILFSHRHDRESCDAHREIVALIHAPVSRYSLEAFRGLGKSTYLEEGAVLRKCFRAFRNMVIVGASYSRAVDRLAAIKREFEINPFIAELFGPQKGESWQEGKIVFADSSCIQAIGRGQSMAGMKHLDWRPDAALIDDLEDPEEVRTDPEREATWKWLKETFLPSLDDPTRSWVRVLGTRRGVGSIPERIEKELHWPVAKFPLYHLDDDGVLAPTWPGKFPAATCRQIEQLYRGDRHTFMQEYMCEAVSEAARVFRREQFRYEPRQRTWEAVYCFIDPARTIGRRSATTAWAAWSWVRGRLVVWGADAGHLLPDEIVALIFDLDERFSPVWIEVEQDGLEEFLLQPIRQEMVRRGKSVPVRGRRAITATRGAGKIAMIGGARGLQPFFEAGEVIFVQEFPELENQLLSFPYGVIDAPNALAYATLTRPAAPIHENFTPAHIVEDLAPAPARPLYMAVNATGAMTTGALLQYDAGVLRILADWIAEGPPPDCIPEIAAQALLYNETVRMGHAPQRERSWKEMLNAAAPDPMILRRTPMNWIVPPSHRERWQNVGLVAAIRSVPAEAKGGGELLKGQVTLRDILGKSVRGSPAVEIGPAASWTLRALAGGYTRTLVHGRLSEEAETGPYRVLMEGIESFVALAAAGGTAAEDDEEANWRVDERTGRRYISAMPSRA